MTTGVHREWSALPRERDPHRRLQTDAELRAAARSAAAPPLLLTDGLDGDRPASGPPAPRRAGPASSPTGWATGWSSSPARRGCSRPGWATTPPDRWRRRSRRAVHPPRLRAAVALDGRRALTRSRVQLLVDELVAQVRSVRGRRRARGRPRRHRRPPGSARGAHRGWSSWASLHERDGDLEHWAEQAHPCRCSTCAATVLALLVAAPLAGAQSRDDLLAVRGPALGGGRCAGRGASAARRAAGAVAPTT